ncbi:MAG: hypothetical protein GC152_13545 [Alphaproteobacteria bacterium]|nr:hypothetical protein [Alphaproteobacteria bacterium]
MLKVFLTASPFLAASIATGTGDVNVGAADPFSPNAPAAIVANDVFSGESLMSEDQMRDAAGGTDAGFDMITFTTNVDIDNTTTIDDIGANIADNDAIVRNIDAGGSTTGQISTINVENNRGITTILNNTGNGVVFQSNVQLNLFVNQGPAPGQQ